MSIRTFTVVLIGGVGTRKTFTLMCIIQNLLQYYIKQIKNVNLLKSKVMKLAYTRKNAFNINTTILSRLTIPLNKSYKLKTLNDEKCDTLIKTYDQLRLIVRDEHIW
jgi:hypothetical protein